jgi:hypothetical protein
MPFIDTDEIQESRQVVAMLGLKDFNELHSLIRNGSIRPMRKLSKGYMFIRSEVLAQWEAIQAARADSSAA